MDARICVIVEVVSGGVVTLYSCIFVDVGSCGFLKL